MQLDSVIIHHPEQGYCLANIKIENSLIEKVTITELDPDFTKAEFYVTPGFVNSHLHPNQLFDRRLLDELNISELLHQMHGNYKKTDDDRYAQALFVLMEAILSGATSIYAVASNPFPVIKAFKTLGVKGAVTCFYNDQWEGYGDAPALAHYQAIENQFFLAHQEKTNDVDIHIGSASIESASNRLLILLNDLAAKFQTKVNTHVCEGKASVESCLKSRKTTPIRLLSQLGILSPIWNLIHAVNIDEEEIALLAAAKANIIHCPVSNAKTGVGVAPIKSLIDKGVTIGLGSDACSNNNTNNILNEAYFASLLHAAIHQDPKVIPLQTLKRWITCNGYQILGRKQRGLIEEGEPADLLLWSLNAPAFVPLPYGNFDSAIINNAPDVKPHTVLINGRVVVDNYKFKLMPEKEICCAANTSSNKIIASIKDETCKPKTGSAF